MSFNENDVNRDHGGRFDHKVGTASDITLNSPPTREEVADRANQLLDEHDLSAQGWVFKFDRAVVRAGACDYAKRTISVSGPLLHTMGQEEVEQVLLHEVAHALTPHANHGPQWQKKARELGYTGKATAKGNNASYKLERGRAEKKPTGYASSGAPLYAGDTFTEAKDPKDVHERKVVGFRRTTAITERTDGAPDPALYSLDYLETLIPDAADRPKSEHHRASKSYPKVGLFIRHGDLFETDGGIQLTAVTFKPTSVLLRGTSGLHYKYSPYGVTRLKRVLQSSSSSA